MLKQNTYIGKYLGGYRITIELYSGSFSRVFLGETISSPTQHVAIKRLYTTHLDSQQEESFLQETRFLKQLQHPHILPIIAAGIDKGSPYLVTGYVANGSLERLLQRHSPYPLPLEEALAIVSQVGQALHYAHGQQIIHCNLKPQNILLDESGQALLADFGLVSILETFGPPPANTSDASPYMAPEQRRGIISKECDLYALGAITYEILTGHKPSVTASLYTPGGSKSEAKPVPPSRLNPTLPSSLDQVILKALEAEPAQRYSDVEAFLTALHACIDIRNMERVTPASAGAEPLMVEAESAQQTTEEADANPPSPSIIEEYEAQPTLALAVVPSRLPMSAPIVDAVSFGVVSAKNHYGRRGSRQQRWLVVGSCVLALVSMLGIAALAFSLYAPEINTRLTNGTTNANFAKGDSSQNGTATPGVVPSPTATDSTKARMGQPAATATSQPSPVPTPTTAHRPTPTPTLIPTPTATPSPRADPTPSGSGEGLTANPSHLSAATCQRRFHNSYRCTATLTYSTNAQSAQNWFAYSSGVSATFSPSSGAISAGQTIQVDILVFDDCTQSGTLFFASAASSATISWGC